MRNVTLILLTLLAAAMFAQEQPQSQPQPQQVETHPLIGEEMDHLILRSPARIPEITVFYLPDTNTVQVTCLSHEEGEVSLLNEFNVQEDHAYCLNTTLSVVSNGFHSIEIQIGGWTLVGEFDTYE